MGRPHSYLMIRLKRMAGISAIGTNQMVRIINVRPASQCSGTSWRMQISPNGSWRMLGQSSGIDCQQNTIMTG